MAKKAFLLGCNSAGLQHCEMDARLMQIALKQHKYEITIIEDANQKMPYGELLKNLQSFLGDCTKSDTVVFYFAGHSLSDGEEFYFILADDINQPENQLWATTLLHPLKRCCAADKVLIFDCCRSGKAAVDYDWDREIGEWCRIFTATSSKETAMEVDGDTNGGLFTSWIYRALTSESAKLADIDGYLRAYTKSINSKIHIYVGHSSLV